MNVINLHIYYIEVKCIKSLILLKIIKIQFQSLTEIVILQQIRISNQLRRMKGPNERQTKPRNPITENNNREGKNNIFNRNKIRSRSISLSPESNFDSFGTQRQRDEKNAHAKQEAYGKMLQIDSYRKNINDKCSFQDLYEGFIRITKGHLQWSLFDPKKALTGTGKIILSNGNFFIALIQVLKKSRSLKEAYGEKLLLHKEEFYKVVENLQEQERKIQEKRKKTELSSMPQQIVPIKLSQAKQFNDNPQQNPQYSGRKSILKKSVFKTKSVSFNPEIQYPQLQSLNQFVEQVQKEERQKLQKKLKQEKLQKIRKDHGILLDTLEINDIYEDENYQIVGTVDQFQDTYAILLIKQKPRVEPPSYVKTRKTYSQREEFQKEFQENKKKQEILCIAVMKDIQNKNHNEPLLKKIESSYHNLSFYNLKKYSQIFMNSLPNQSVVKSAKKQNNFKAEVQLAKNRSEQIKPVDILKQPQIEIKIQKQQQKKQFVFPIQNFKTQGRQIQNIESTNIPMENYVNIRITRQRQNENPNIKSNNNNVSDNNYLSSKNIAVLSNPKGSNVPREQTPSIMSRVKNQLFGLVPKGGSKNLSNGK